MGELRKDIYQVTGEGRAAMHGSQSGNHKGERW
jgi:hypothetical protein